MVLGRILGVHDSLGVNRIRWGFTVDYRGEFGCDLNLSPRNWNQVISLILGCDPVHRFSLTEIHNGSLKRWK